MPLIMPCSFAPGIYYYFRVWSTYNSCVVALLGHERNTGGSIKDLSWSTEDIAGAICKTHSASFTAQSCFGLGVGHVVTST